MRQYPDSPTNTLSSFLVLRRGKDRISLSFPGFIDSFQYKMAKVFYLGQAELKLVF